MEEQWRDIVGYEGLYQVSDRGRVRSLDRSIMTKTGKKKYKGRVLQGGRDTWNYHQVTLCAPGRKNRVVKTHKLVAEAFIGPCPDGAEVRHGLNGIDDNSVDNLSYGTHKQNMCNYKMSEACNWFSAVIRSDGVKFPSMQIAAKSSGADVSSISKICRGKGRTSGGYGWQYANPNKLKHSGRKKTAGSFGWRFAEGAV